jgi:hypothetical protein
MKIALVKHILLLGAAFFFALMGTMSAKQAGVVGPESWSGVIINSGCTVNEAFAEAPKCTQEAPGTKLALYDDTTRQIFDLDPQDPAVGHLGESVTVQGSLAANTIRVSSLQALSIGLAVGQRAPGFFLRDQFGRLQTLTSLTGRRGTVLLFFRSADW